MDLSGWGHFYCVGARAKYPVVLKNSVSSGMKGGYLAACGVLLAMRY